MCGWRDALWSRRRTAFYFQSPVVKSVAVNGGRTFALFTNGNFQVGSMYTLIGATVTVQ
jgi:hypothetical protein